MFRVQTSEIGPRTVVKVDGQLSDPCARIVEDCCRASSAAGKKVELELTGVTSIGQAGRALLDRLAASGVRLLGRGVYTAHLIHAALERARAPRSPK